MSTVANTMTDRAIEWAFKGHAERNSRKIVAVWKIAHAEGLSAGNVAVNTARDVLGAFKGEGKNRHTGEPDYAMGYRHGRHDEHEGIDRYPSFIPTQRTSREKIADAVRTAIADDASFDTEDIENVATALGLTPDALLNQAAR